MTEISKKNKKPVLIEWLNLDFGPQLGLTFLSIFTGLKLMVWGSVTITPYYLPQTFQSYNVLPEEKNLYDYIRYSLDTVKEGRLSTSKGKLHSSKLLTFISVLFFMATYSSAPNYYIGKRLRVDLMLFYVEIEMTMSAEKSKKTREVTSYCDWMSQLPAELHSIPLCNLTIPGMKLK